MPDSGQVDEMEDDAPRRHELAPEYGPSDSPGGREHTIQRAYWAVGFGVASLLSVALAILGLDAPVGAGYDTPESVRYHRMVSLLLGLGVVLAVSALRMANSAAGRAQFLGLTLGGIGLVASGGFLLLLIGLCGVQVIWWGCSP
jgi:hypothetical protein